MGILNYITIDTVCGAIILGLFIYFVIVVKKKKYKFMGADGKKFRVKSVNYKRDKKNKKSKGEERCREIFEQIFGVKFKSVRPSFLLNPVTGKNLELDGYNDTIKTSIGKGLAFEMDGIQHSQYTPHFHKDPQEFLYQCKKDSFKDLKCKEHKIVLIRIPHYISSFDLERHIRDKLAKKGLL